MSDDPERRRAPPDAGSVALRALCLAELAGRAGWELGYQTAGLSGEDPAPLQAEAERAVDESRFWLGDCGLITALSDRERRLMDAPLGSWPTDDLAEMALVEEAAVMLCWALGVLGTLPSFAEPAPDAAIDTLLAVEDPLDFAEAASLRPFPEIEDACRLAELWQARGESELLERSGAEPRPGRTASRDTRAALGLAARLGGFAPIEDDFPVDGVGFRRLDDAQVTICLGIAEQRLKALTWACGLVPDWDGEPPPRFD